MGIAIGVLLIVALIWLDRAYAAGQLAGLLLIVALIWLVASRAARSSPVTCQQNMRTIATGEQSYRARSRAHQYVVIVDSVPTMLADGRPIPADEPFFGGHSSLTAMPVCPKGGLYQVRVAPPGGASYTDGFGNVQTVPEGELLISCSCPGPVVGHPHPE